MKLRYFPIPWRLAGVLAIGSRDPQRFHEGKRVDFLQRLAEVVSAKLQSASSPGI